MNMNSMNSGFKPANFATKVTLPFFSKVAVPETVLLLLLQKQ
jgi:hypothetical protein